jgi:hypothetical protein
MLTGIRNLRQTFRLRNHSPRSGSKQAVMFTWLEHMSYRIPAARAACTPANASSMTTHWAGGTPRALDAARKMSGEGFRRSKRSAETTASKLQARTFSSQSLDQEPNEKQGAGKHPEDTWAGSTGRVWYQGVSPPNSSRPPLPSEPVA